LFYISFFWLGKAEDIKLEYYNVFILLFCCGRYWKKNLVLCYSLLLYTH